MLAQEAHRRRRPSAEQRRPRHREERVNDTAPIICCTVEMAPVGEVLVLDEVQWADDPERGSAWTGLLLAGITATSSSRCARRGAARPAAFPDAELKVFERILPLEFVGQRALRA